MGAFQQQCDAVCKSEKEFTVVGQSFVRGKHRPVSRKIGWIVVIEICVTDF